MKYKKTMKCFMDLVEKIQKKNKQFTKGKCCMTALLLIDEPLFLQINHTDLDVSFNDTDKTLTKFVKKLINEWSKL